MPAGTDGSPKALGVWLYGDGPGNHLRVRFVDASGQTFQPDGPPLKGKEWRYVTFPMDGTSANHWGGTNDGVIRYPIRWDSILLIDSNHRESGPRQLFLGSPMLVYPLGK